MRRMAYLGADPASKDSHRLALGQVQTGYHHRQEEEVPQKVLSYAAISARQPFKRLATAYLRCADLVVGDEYDRLDEACEHKVVSPCQNETSCHRRHHLRDESRNGMSSDGGESIQGRFGLRQHGICAKHRLVDRVEVGRKVVSVVEPSYVIQIGMFQERVTPAAKEWLQLSRSILLRAIQLTWRNKTRSRQKRYWR